MKKPFGVVFVHTVESSMYIEIFKKNISLYVLYFIDVVIYAEPQERGGKKKIFFFGFTLFPKRYTSASTCQHESFACTMSVGTRTNSEQWRTQSVSIETVV